MHDNIKSKNEINENFTEWKTMLKCVNPSYAAAAALCFHCLLQHFPHAHTLAGARTHTDAHVRNTFARGWHFFPFSSVDLLVSMVSRIAHRKNVRRSVFFGCGKPGGIYAWVEIDFISRIAAIRRICRSTCQQNLHFCHRSVCAGVCSLSLSRCFDLRFVYCCSFGHCVAFDAVWSQFSPASMIRTMASTFLFFTATLNRGIILAANFPTENGVNHWFPIYSTNDLNGTYLANESMISARSWRHPSSFAFRRNSVFVFGTN